jgi:hypothetical protein
MKNQLRHMAGKQLPETYLAVIEDGKLQYCFKTISPNRAEQVKVKGTVLVELTEAEFNLMSLCNCQLDFALLLLSSVEHKIIEGVKNVQPMPINV